MAAQKHVTTFSANSQPNKTTQNTSAETKCTSLKTKLKNYPHIEGTEQRTPHITVHN